MQLKTILNNVERHKSFVYGTPRWFDPITKTAIDVPIEPRANSKPICSGCKQSGSCYDHLQERRFEFVPLWGIAVYFIGSSVILVAREVFREGLFFENAHHEQTH